MDPIFFEKVLLKLFFISKEINEKVLPFLNTDVFDDGGNIKIVEAIIKHYEKYSKMATPSEMKLLVDAPTWDHLFEIMNMDITEYEGAFLLSEVEDFFRKKLILDAISKTAVNLKDDKMDKVSCAPDEIREALSFSFDTEVGLDFVEAEKRLYEFLHNKENVVETGLPVFDSLIDGGFHEKSLSLFMAETNMGKSLIMASLAVNCFLKNKNVLYVTLEMSEEKMAERMMANVFDIPVDDLRSIVRHKFDDKFKDLRKTMKQKIMVKEFPTSSISCNHIRNLLKELEIRKKFKPDIVFVDYLGILRPATTRKSDNSYSEVRRISEELRGLAVEHSIPFVSAVQTNRDGFNSAEIDMTDISDSIGTAGIADLIIGVTQTDELRNLGKYSWIILKNRYGINKKKVTENVDYYKMRIYEEEQTEATETIASEVAGGLPPSEKDKSAQVDVASDKVNGILNKNKDDKWNKQIDYE